MARFMLLPNQPPYKGRNPKTGEELLYQPGQVIESDEDLAAQDPERFAPLRRFKLRPGVGQHIANDSRGVSQTYNADGTGAGAIVESHTDLAATMPEKFAALDEKDPRPFSAGFGPAANPPPRPSPQNPDPPGSKHAGPPPGIEPGPAPTPTSLGSHAAVRQTPVPTPGPGQRQMQPTSAIPGVSSVPPSRPIEGGPPGSPVSPQYAGQSVGHHAAQQPQNRAGQPAHSRAELEGMTVNELKALAHQDGIDLAGARNKDDIVDAILEAQESD